jgi:hypothetical protein
VILSKFSSRFDLRQRRNRKFLGDDQGCLHVSKRTDPDTGMSSALTLVVRRPSATNPTAMPPPLCRWPMHHTTRLLSPSHGLCVGPSFVCASRFPPASHPRPASRFPLPASRFPLLASRFPLLASRFSLPASRFPLLASRFPRPASRFPLPASRFSLPASHFPLRASRVALGASQRTRAAHGAAGGPGRRLLHAPATPHGDARGGGLLTVPGVGAG